MARKVLLGLFFLAGVASLLGCDVIFKDFPGMGDSGTRVYAPERIVRKVSRVKCGPNCADIIAAAQLDATHLRTATFKQIAARQNMTAHEQIHLINTLIDLEYKPTHEHWEPEDVLKVLAYNASLTRGAKMYFSRSIDQFSSITDRQRKDIIKLLTNNQGVADPPEAGVVIVEYELEDIEVVWCDYYGFDYQVVADLREMGCRTDDITVILHLAYCAHCEPFIIVRWYTIQRLSWIDIAFGKLNLQPAVFFMNVDEPERLGPPYGRAYGKYRNSPNDVSLSNSEAVDLVQLKVTCECYSVSPEEVIENKNRGNNIESQVKTYRRTRETSSSRQYKPAPSKKQHQDE